MGSPNHSEQKTISLSPAIKEKSWASLCFNQLRAHAQGWTHQHRQEKCYVPNKAWEKTAHHSSKRMVFRRWVNDNLSQIKSLLWNEVQDSFQKNFLGAIRKRGDRCKDSNKQCYHGNSITLLTKSVPTRTFKGSVIMTTYEQFAFNHLILCAERWYWEGGSY